VNKNARENSGSALDLEFAAECIRRGAVVSQPFGGNAQYDFLVDNGKSILRVQVKSASPREDGRSFSVNLTRKLPKTRPSDPGGSSRSVPYDEGVLDCIVTRANGVWFFFDKPHTLSDESIYPEPNVRMHKGNRGEDRWDLIGLARTGETGALEKDSSHGDTISDP
jgi:hypothetical protein